jgi:hypothetical protein
MADDTPKPIDQRMTEIMESIEQYQRRAGIPLAVPPGTEDELNDYLNMDFAKINSFSAEECAGVGVRLAQFSLYIQRLVNTETSRRIWANSQVDYLVGKHIPQYIDMVAKAEIKVQMIAQENVAVQKLLDIVRFCSQRISTLDYVARGISGVQQALERVERAKVARLYNDK